MPGFQTNRQNGCSSHLPHPIQNSILVSRRHPTDNKGYLRDGGRIRESSPFLEKRVTFVQKNDSFLQSGPFRRAPHNRRWRMAIENSWQGLISFLAPSQKYLRS